MKHEEKKDDYSKNPLLTIRGAKRKSSSSGNLSGLISCLGEPRGKTNSNLKDGQVIACDGSKVTLDREAGENQRLNNSRG